MESFALNTEAYYLERYGVWRAKTGEAEKSIEILQQHMPLLFQKLFRERQQLNILSVGSAEGEKDMMFLKIIKEELQTNDHGRYMKIFNRAIEPNKYSCGVYKAAIENLPSPLDDQQIAFEIREQTFEEYQESHKEPVKFDIVHFIHSIYYVDIKQTLLYCFEKELNDEGHFVCISGIDGIVHPIYMKLHSPRLPNDVACETFDPADQLIQIAKEYG